MPASAKELLIYPGEKRIAESLAHLQGRVIQIDQARWRWRLHGESKARTTIVHDRGWVVVERPLAGYSLNPRGRVMRWIWGVLDPEMPLAAGARIVLPVGENRAQIRTETPLSPVYRDGPEQLARWIENACAAASNWTRRARSGTVDLRVGQHSESTDVTAVDIPALCELTGWSSSVRQISGKTMVMLPAREGGVCHAVVTQEGSTLRFRLALEVEADGEVTPASQLAAAIALLRLAGGVRLVKVSATRTDGAMSAALEVQVQTPIDAEWLNHTLSALALAHQQIAEELEALVSDDVLASAYLRLQYVA